MSAAAKIGLFMLAALIILGVFILKIEDIPLGERGDRLHISARFPSAAGVDRKAAVRIAGVRVGMVEEIRLEGTQAVIDMSLDPGVVVHRGARAQVTSLGMLGDKYVDIDPGDPEAPALEEGAVIEGGAPPSFDDALEVATEIGGDLREVTRSLRASLGGPQGQQALEEIVANIRELTASMKDLIQQNQANVNATTENFRDFSAALRDELPRLADKLNLLADQLNDVVADNRDELSGSLANIEDLTGRLRASADNLNTITGKIASGEGTIGKLVNDDETVDNINETLDSIEGGVATLQNTMGRFERFKLDVTLRSEALPGAEDSDGNAQSRSAFGFDLWTTPKRFVRVEGVDSPYGQTKTTTETVTTVYDDGTESSYTQTRVKTKDTFDFNAQIGYRLLPSTTVRAGLFETAGGFGVDQDLDVGDRKLRLTFEAYDFNRELDLDTHLRLESRFFFNRNLFLMAGWDDPLVSERSSVLIGGGITWTDDDLKYTLGLAGSAVN